MPVIHDNVAVSLGTLAGTTAISGASKIDNARRSGVQMQKGKTFGSVTYQGKTDGEGPLLFGVAHTLTDLQIDDTLSADPQGFMDSEKSDDANRPLVVWGLIPLDGIEDVIAGGMKYHRHFKMFSWKIREGVGLKYWVWNVTANALQTGTTVRFHMTHVYRWLED